ncbi:unnamed protein product [Tuber aestivum]|uniref:Swiss Army Knife protein DSP-PTPase phosphatase domain-containing protein n=1 Tax=Tuber aestivum TaxID=59557 RepID=A0A292PU03_9PEZI|nr:unnamed protein product [Tuber aestivum]
MFPPGCGNDVPVVGQIYVISLFGTNQVLTGQGGELSLKEYQEGHWDQMWVFHINSDHWHGMKNRSTGCFLGRAEGNKTRCSIRDHRLWEYFSFVRHGLGGYSMMMSPHDGGRRLGLLQRIDSDDKRLTIGEAGTQFGLHLVKNPVFRRFEWVVPDRLARSSAPYYDGEDSDESINETSIEFLHNHGIHNIISLNSVEITPREKGRLRAAKISYSHIIVPECTAPTQEQFDQIWNAYKGALATIVYCGYGDGRTGMAISAIQLCEGRPLGELDFRANGAQCRGQIEALNALSERIHGSETHDDPPDTRDIEPRLCVAPERGE